MNVVDTDHSNSGCIDGVMDDLPVEPEGGSFLIKMSPSNLYLYLGTGSLAGV